ncbi:MAG: DsbA family oxidoreductase [Gemmobacter sp.]|nr:DsbA family oxidoreductase [Gemmobacter sp.]
MTPETQPLRIDIVSDVVCPWCIVGYRQLATALKATGIAHEIHWHPFELNPDMPAEGQNLREHIMQKYGSTLEQSDKSRAQLAQIGSEIGFDFQFSDATRMHNTFNLHQLLHWAGLQDRKQDLKLALFAAHFTHGKNLSDTEVLADVAAGIGLDRAEALAVLSDQRFAADVRAEERFWVSQGISGVPAVVFNQRHLVTGAQGVENYTSILHQLSQMQE